MKELEQFQPFFYEEIINCQNVDLMAELSNLSFFPGPRPVNRLMRRARLMASWRVRQGDVAPR